ncbi:hypothetical protein ACLB2K_036169 [Fragaria x ananassa]
MYDSAVLIHPQECFQHGDKYMLLFNKVVTDFQHWIEEHEQGRVTDKEMWEILNKIGNNLIYLSSKNRPHGNLKGGIVITTESRPLFLNLVATTDLTVPTFFKSDIKDLKEILQKVEEKMLAGSENRKCVERWKAFLSKSCLDVKPEVLPLNSRISPLYFPNHVNLVFNYPTVWDVENKRRFLANMYMLCKDLSEASNLLENEEFRSHLCGCDDYSNWPTKLPSGVSVLNEVYQFGSRNGQYTSQESIIFFADDCVRHHYQSTQRYNKPGPTVKLPEVKSSNIFDELYTHFPYLIEYIYEAFRKALAGGYAHSTFTVGDILTGTL